MAERMVNNNCDKLSEFEVVDIIKKAYPNISSASFLKELESNILESQIMI
jgi:hypothetical protein